MSVLSNEQGRNITLTATELGELWKNYLGETLIHCMYSHYLENVEDERVKQLIEKAQTITTKHIAKLKELFNKENFPIPSGFSENDVISGASRIFSDKFYLFYIKEMSRINLLLFSNALTVSFREDVRRYFDECIDDISELYQDSMNALLAKGLIIRAPFIPIPKQAEYVNDKDFLHKLIGKQRPISATEISGIYIGLDSNQLGKSIMVGFSQVVEDQEIKQYMLRGRDISQKNVNVLQDVLTADHLPSPQLWDAEVLASKEPPFSEKLMLFHVSLATSGSLLNYSFAIAGTYRYDITQDITRLVGEIGHFLDDGAKMLIKKGWFEQPPLAADRDKLAE